MQIPPPHRQHHRSSAVTIIYNVLPMFAPAPHDRFLAIVYWRDFAVNILHFSLLSLPPLPVSLFLLSTLPISPQSLLLNTLTVASLCFYCSQNDWRIILQECKRQSRAYTTWYKYENTYRHAIARSTSARG